MSIANATSPLIDATRARYGFESKAVPARKGDVFSWHANLVHGGSPTTDTQLSRKALVCHYFAEGGVGYHDLSGNQTRLRLRGMQEPVADENLEGARCESESGTAAFLTF